MGIHNPEFIAVTAALAREFGPLRQIAPKGVVFFKTGMGQQKADPAIRTFLAQHQPRLLINTGFAGALSPSLEIGDIVIANRLRRGNPVDRPAEIEVSDKALSIPRSLKNVPAYYGTAVTVNNIATTEDKELLA